jgi:hypothetical protein
MRRRLMIVSLGSLLCLTATAQKPTADQQKQTLDAAREIAVHYAGKLPDFICNEQVERSNNAPGNIKVDRLLIQLTYFEQKEKQKLVTLNGLPATQPLESLDGLITAGEFGSLQLGIFDPTSAADFQWKSSSEIRKRRAAVYTYRIARAKSHYVLGYRDAAGNMVSVPAGYRGEVALDLETNRVLRVTASADDIPKESNITVSSAEVDYDFMDVGGKSYLLPSRSASSMERGYRKIGNVVTFVDYKKFEADSSISFKN